MLKKQYAKSKPVCKVTFTLPKEAASNAQEVRLVGDFNNWNVAEAAIMDATAKEYKTVLDLPTGRAYEFRYLIDQSRWENDWAADGYVTSPFLGTDNSVVSLITEETGNGAPVVKEVEAPAAGPKKTTKKAATTQKAAPAKPAVKQAEVKAVKVEKDDLTKIEGVGPKIASLLAAEKIITFADLAKAKVTTLKAILEAAGSRYKMHDPATWSEQAKLAAAGEWKKLEALQADLKGGKR